MKTATEFRTIPTLGEFKRDLKKAKKLYVLVQWAPDEGDYIEVPKSKFMFAIRADSPCDGAYGGRPDSTPIDYIVRENGEEIYVN